jgi:hypothetical protein
MKICDGEKKKKMLYKELKGGDVFEWVDPTKIRGAKVKISTPGKLSHVYLARGTITDTYPTLENHLVTLFPHACLTLGKPE